ncbi:aldehyde ferredoxin oxidoreductase family protein [Acidilobus sp.]|uniref:aldehyde ferredoxin oxidoreductase family protein n=1 Tax=Acidilobus sp. TaxID=1872109 RepID=UPI003D0613B7
MGGFSRLIRVDLGSGEVKYDELRDEDVKAYLGGRGIGLLLALKGGYGRPQDPLSPELPLIIASGPLSGAGIPLSSRATAVFFSPLSRRWSYSTVGGSLAVIMRYAGADVLMVTGRAQRPSYIVVEGGKAEVRDASGLWGTGTFEAEKALKEVHGNEAAVAVIGPAGENLVPFASINHETWRQFGRSGGGAVMGSKNLKAVVFVPSGRAVEAADPERTWSLINYMTQRLAAAAKSYRDNGTLGTIDVANGTGFFPSLYWTGVSAPGWRRISWYEVLSKNYFIGKRATCLHCPVACHKVVTSRRYGGYYELEYETTMALAGLTGVVDPDELIQLASLVDDMGLDTISTGNVLGLLAYLTEKGYVDPSEGVRFGDAQRFRELITAIAKREGVGKVLSMGAREAARALGHPEVAIEVKGLEPAGYDPRTLKGMILTYAVAERGADHLWSSGYAIDIPGLAGGRQATGEEKVRAVMDLEERNAIYDSAVLCKFGRNAYGWDELVQVLNAVTGFNYDQASLRETAERIIVIHRYMNGTTVEDDRLPPRWLREPVEFEGKRYVVTEEEWRRMVMTYYKLRGYDEEGRPTRETLERLGIIKAAGG